MSMGFTNSSGLKAISGDGTPTGTPLFTGQLYIDTTNKMLWYSTGTSSSSDWVNLDGTVVDGSIFSDDFNRTDENPISGNNWSSKLTTGAYDHRELLNNELRLYGGNNNSSGYLVYRNIEDYEKERFEITYKFRFEAYLNTTKQTTTGSAPNMYHGVCVGTSNNNIVTTYDTYTFYGVCVNFSYYQNTVSGTTPINKIQVYNANTKITDTSFTFALDTTYKTRINKNGSTLKVRVWDTSSSEPATWNITTTISGDWNTSGNYLDLWAYAGDSSSWYDHIFIDEFDYSE